MTYELEKIWKLSASAPVDQISNSTLFRYVSTREGVYRIYPAIHIPIKFDPTEQPQYVVAKLSY